MHIRISILPLAIASLGLLAPVIAFSQERTTREAGDFDEKVFDSPFTMSLDAGLLSFQEPGDAADAVEELGDENRFTGGLRLNWNLTNIGGGSLLHLGLGTGAYYSRLSGEGAQLQGEGSNLFMFPLNAQLGLSPGGVFHIAAHGGVNGILRTDDRAIRVNDEPGDGSSSFDFYPNVGANLGIGLGSDIGLGIRGDYTITPGDDLISATAGLVFSIG